ncbi:polysaccharide biosynthesis/export family protein [Psychroflexus planctonicus]|uniref:polysaccharide biosynthesis/export family protein n=1 Tax=Psychroflexus planctonicus TaxID=1526575 RepID=UPI00166A27B2|nr:polysaccharide biosynthesis/export family protein [Psychroflexus planctonicus]
MSRNFLVLSLLCLVLASSCISRKQITYLQQGDEDLTDSLISLQKLQEPYRVQINDLLSIRVKALDQELVSIFNPVTDANATATTEESAYFDGYKVDRQGEIRIPNLGKIKVIGLTLEEIEQLVEKELLDKSFKEEANLYVTVRLPGIRYTTLGEFGSQGGQVFYRPEVTLTEAVANAGGFNLTGDMRNLVILRQYPDGKRIHHVDMTSIDAINSPYYYIQPNDVLIANPLPQKTLGLGENAFSTITSLIGIITTFSILFIRFN